MSGLDSVGKCRIVCERERSDTRAKPSFREMRSQAGAWEPGNEANDFRPGHPAALPSLLPSERVGFHDRVDSHTFSEIFDIILCQLMRRQEHPIDTNIQSEMVDP